MALTNQAMARLPVLYARPTHIQQPSQRYQQRRAGAARCTQPPTRGAAVSPTARAPRATRALAVSSARRAKRARTRAVTAQQAAMRALQTVSPWQWAQYRRRHARPVRCTRGPTRGATTSPIARAPRATRGQTAPSAWHAKQALTRAATARLRARCARRTRSRLPLERCQRRHVWRAHCTRGPTRGADPNGSASAQRATQGQTALSARRARRELTKRRRGEPAARSAMWARSRPS